MPEETQKKPAPNSDEILRLVIESITDFAVFSTDPAGIVLSWNVGAERLFGYAEQEILGRSGDVVFTPEDRGASQPERERHGALANGRSVDERWHIRKNGTRFWASGLLMRFEGGVPGFVKICRDRTEQYQALENLKENEERFRLLATSIPQMVFRTRPGGYRTWGSPQWISFTGMTLAESLGEGWLDAVHPEDRELTHSAWQDALTSGEYYVEHRVLGANGIYRWHQTRAKPTRAPITAALDWVGTMTDIHHLRDLQSRQQLLMAELQHRTRNLLAVVQAVANQTARTSQSLTSFTTEFSSRLRSLSRVQELIARIDAETIDLRELVEIELAAHSREAVQSGRVVTSGPSVDLPTTAAQALGLALHELATNAVKYGALAHQDGQLEVAWDIRHPSDATEIHLEWRESGVAMQAGKPQRKGYGTELIERALPRQLHARTKIDYGLDGVFCTIDVPIGGGQVR